MPFKNYVVKAFNHIPSGDIATDGTLAGDPDRRALAIARTGAELIENIAKATR